MLPLYLPLCWEVEVIIAQRCDNICKGAERYLFYSTPSWLYHNSTLGLYFLLAACAHEDEWGIGSFSTLLKHKRCPFCHVQHFRATSQPQHMLCDCSGVALLAQEWGLHFV